MGRFRVRSGVYSECMVLICSCLCTFMNKMNAISSEFSLSARRPSPHWTLNMSKQTSFIVEKPMQRKDTVLKHLKSVVPLLKVFIQLSVIPISVIFCGDLCHTITADAFEHTEHGLKWP